MDRKRFQTRIWLYYWRQQFIDSFIYKNIRNRELTGHETDLTEDINTVLLRQMQNQTHSQALDRICNLIHRMLRNIYLISLVIYWCCLKQVKYEDFIIEPKQYTLVPIALYGLYLFRYCFAGANSMQGHSTDIYKANWPRYIRVWHILRLWSHKSTSPSILYNWWQINYHQTGLHPVHHPRNVWPDLYGTWCM